jgi:hypothetical protein
MISGPNRKSSCRIERPLRLLFLHVQRYFRHYCVFDAIEQGRFASQMAFWHQDKYHLQRADRRRNNGII